MYLLLLIPQASEGGVCSVCIMTPPAPQPLLPAVLQVLASVTRKRLTHLLGCLNPVAALAEVSRGSQSWVVGVVICGECGGRSSRG